MNRGIIIIVMCIGAVIGIIIQRKKDYCRLYSEQKKVEKWNSYYQLLKEWLAIKSGENSIAYYFYENRISHIAIYGMGDIGELLWYELNGIINIDYVIDKNPLAVGLDVEAYSPEDNLPKTEMVIVTVCPEYQNIKDILEKKISCPIVSLEEVIYAV